MPSGTHLITGGGRLLTPEPYDGPSPWAIVGPATAWSPGSGHRADAPAADDEIDLGTALVTPGLVDAHTHPVYAGDRSDEAAARLAGQPYTGGGILRTVAATRAATDERARVAGRGPPARRQLRAGTTTVECKSGYGLSARRRSCGTSGSSGGWRSGCRCTSCAPSSARMPLPPDEADYVGGWRTRWSRRSPPRAWPNSATSSVTPASSRSRRRSAS